MAATPARRGTTWRAPAHRATIPHAGLFALEGGMLGVLVALSGAVDVVRGALPGDLGVAEFTQLLLPHRQITAILDGFSTIGWPQVAGPVLVAVLLLLWFIRWRLAALCLLLLTAFADGSNFALAELIRRPRPQGPGIHVLARIATYYSFPSGHVEHFLAFCGFLLFLTLLARRRAAWWLVLLRIVLVVVILTMGVSRILEGEHWPSDVLGGYLLGAFWLVIGVHAYRYVSTRAATASWRATR